MRYCLDILQLKLMAIKDKIITKVFSKEGTDQSKEPTKPMKPKNILPIFQLIIALLMAIICITPLTINIIKQGGL